MYQPSDDIEKAVQVNMINTIYRNCSGCVVWLGPKADNSESAMRLIRAVQFLVRHVYPKHIFYGKRCRDDINPTFMRALAICPIFAAVLRIGTQGHARGRCSMCVPQHWIPYYVETDTEARRL